MGNFTDFILTRKGVDLFVKNQVGKGINFTRISYGSGNPIVDGVLTSEPYEFADLIRHMGDGIILNVALVGNGTTSLKAEINNEKLTESVLINEIGIFADDPDLGEILYSYSYAEQPTFIPSNKNGIPGGDVRIEWEMITAVGNATVVKAEIRDTSPFILAKNFNENIYTSETMLDNDGNFIINVYKNGVLHDASNILFNGYPVVNKQDYTRLKESLATLVRRMQSGVILTDDYFLPEEEAPPKEPEPIPTSVLAKNVIYENPEFPDITNIQDGVDIALKVGKTLEWK